MASKALPSRPTCGQYADITRVVLRVPNFHFSTLAHKGRVVEVRLMHICGLNTHRNVTFAPLIDGRVASLRTKLHYTWKFCSKPR